MSDKSRPGYPEGAPSLAWLKQKLHEAEQRLVKLTAMKAPERIVETERRLIEKRKGWIEAWKKEHQA